jgi:hypothetical protein
MLKHIEEARKQQMSRISGSYIPTETLEKGGEGSKGGKVIGHTKSGKAVYDNANHESHKDFTSQDHKEARTINEKKYSKHWSDRNNAGFGKEKRMKAAQKERYHADQARAHGDQEFAKKESASEKGTLEQALLAKQKSADSDKYKDWSSEKHEEQSHSHHGNMMRAKQKGDSKGEMWEKNEYNKHKGLAEDKKDKEIKKGQDINLSYTTPFEYQAIEKARIAEAFNGDQAGEIEVEHLEKGKKAMPGEKREFGGKEYMKTASGWRLVGKNKGKTKDAHDTIHGKKPTLIDVLNDPDGKKLVEELEGLDPKRKLADGSLDHLGIYNNVKKELKEKHNYDYVDSDEWKEAMGNK